jgi:hypothetical protein
MSDKTYNRIQNVGPWIAGITAVLGLISLFFL